MKKELDRANPFTPDGRLRTATQARLDAVSVFDVVTGQCEAAGAPCTSGGTAGAAIGLTTWTFVDDDPGCCTPPMDSLVAWPNDLHLRVYRTTSGASCAAYQLQFSR